MLALAGRDLAKDRSNGVHSPIHGTLCQEPLLEGWWQIERMGDNVREQPQRNGLVQERSQIGIKFSLTLEKLAKQPDQLGPRRTLRESGRLILEDSYLGDPIEFFRGDLSQQANSLAT